MYIIITTIINVILTLNIESTLKYIVCFVTRRNKTVTLKTKRGVRCLVQFNSSDKGELISILSNREYGPLIDIIYKECSKEWVVLGIGANIGLFSIWLERACGIKGAKILVEPDPENLKILKVNLLLNKIQNYQIIEKAVYMEKGNKNFSVVEDYHARYLTDSNTNTITVETDTITGIIAREGLGRIGILKMDIEGGEWDLFNEENYDAFLDACVLAIEYHANRFNNFGNIERYFRNRKVLHFQKNETTGIIYIYNI
ncbi:hypothetical protein COT50_02485 [candidate division WWE3 bacterium CG08_land_8_20_14_0_20_41_10]|uniref:Methyltransferase FkbM domain-containing protein n=1 Tax=candidate division WWE3 bacterium CG08_land_8_20_14_0_20_41_10 TaxID=1975085 RepID=A0A2H0XBN2_UNCKA|nr:MAG: hypothetical protein COT50_02485 [candidate division WWE3 bacterium CG08_land_8_20_14_0_20_41_10]